MTGRQAKLVNIILFSTITGSLFLLVRDNQDEAVILSILIGAFALIHYFRYLKYRIPLRRPLAICLLLLQLLIALIVQAIDGMFLAQIFFFILIAEVAYRTSKKISLPFMLLSYFSYVGAVAYHFGFPPFAEIGYVIPRSIEYILFWGFSYIARHAVQQKEQLENLNKKLKKAAKELEGKTLLQERLRLSKEIHDTVGHALTTAYFGIETSKHMLQAGKVNEGVEQLERSKGYIQRSLEDARSIVHTISEHSHFVNMQESLNQLIQDTEIQSNVKIVSEIAEDLPVLSPEQQLAIYRGLQEGLTNGIRHGKSRSFFYRLKKSASELTITLEDRGQFNENASFGFGLKAMNKRFQIFGGSVQIFKNNNGGCTLTMFVPIENES